jgi:hypothetical protein
VGLADNPIYQRVVPASVRAVIDDYTNRVKAGQIDIVTAFGMDQPTFTRFVDAVRP